MHASACAMARAAEVAGLVGGADAYWRMHEWLLSHQSDFGSDMLRSGFEELGLDAGAALSAMNRPEVAQAISEDCVAGQRLGLTSIPMIFVNGRFAERWRMDGQPVLQTIIEKAARAAK
jgi:protein-disulfide isomerase